MKLKFLLPCTIFAIIALASCKKDSSTNDTDEIETTFALSANEGISENLTQDANDVLNEATFDKNLQGLRGTGIAETTGTLSCANITITPLNEFPKTIVIDFGTTGCTSNNGVTRKGIININLTDSFRRPGSVATMTFNNYYVGGYKKEGTITWTNNSSAGVKSWSRVCANGKITSPNGDFWLHEGTQQVVQTAGSSTKSLLDDVFSITGTRTVTNSAGRVRVGTVIAALQKKTMCDNIDQGIYQIKGPNHIATINYGDGTCDRVATISIDGKPARNFLLR